MCGRGYDCAARSNSAISSFFIFSIACIAFGCLNQLRQTRGHDLPTKTELVLEPAALNLGSPGRELGPILIHFLLRVASHNE